MPGVYSLLYQAIEEKKQVIAMYDGYLREMCPHVLGSKDGVRHVLSFQFSGVSSQGLPPGGQWKCMAVDGGWPVKRIPERRAMVHRPTRDWKPTAVRLYCTYFCDPLM